MVLFLSVCYQPNTVRFKTPQCPSVAGFYKMLWCHGTTLKINLLLSYKIFFYNAIFAFSHHKLSTS